MEKAACLGDLIDYDTWKVTCGFVWQCITLKGEEVERHTFNSTKVCHRSFDSRPDYLNPMKLIPAL